MKYTGIVISDIHVGAFDISKLYEEYTNIFINYIKRMKKLDFVIITGDFFHHKFYLNDKEVSIAYKMINDLVDACKENTQIRFVYGTESHEANQYSILSVINLSKNLRVIRTVEEEEILPDLKVLYIPEEYVDNKDEYYKKYFDKTDYSYIFGHGIIREVMKDAVSHINTSSDKRKKVPIFTSKELEGCCKGQVFFGHYHINYDINKKIFSVGSFSRWCFGEDGQKGFYKIKYDTENDNYNEEFIENTLADTYKTIAFGYKSNIYNNTENMNDELNRIDDMIKNKIFDHVRFEFNIPSNNENPEAIINYIKERYKFNDNIKVNFTNGYIEEKKRLKEEIDNKEKDKYDFIFDSIPIEDKIKNFIAIEYNKNVSLENISMYLKNSVEEILSESTY